MGRQSKYLRKRVSKTACVRVVAWLNMKDHRSALFEWPLVDETFLILSSP